HYHSLSIPKHSRQNLKYCRRQHLLPCVLGVSGATTVLVFQLQSEKRWRWQVE
ncbi:unnamed protein product, partial [Linum tenue]